MIVSVMPVDASYGFKTIVEGQLFKDVQFQAVDIEFVIAFSGQEIEMQAHHDTVEDLGLLFGIDHGFCRAFDLMEESLENFQGELVFGFEVIVHEP